jgi:hypothetical protein
MNSCMLNFLKRGKTKDKGLKKPEQEIVDATKDIIESIPAPSPESLIQHALKKPKIEDK